MKVLLFLVPLLLQFLSAESFGNHKSNVNLRRSITRRPLNMDVAVSDRTKEIFAKMEKSLGSTGEPPNTTNENTSCHLQLS